MTLTEFIKSNSDLICQKELTFFGGSFNPWHEGHTSCLKLFSTNSPLIIIPDHNPAKELVKIDTKGTDLNNIKSKLKESARVVHMFDGFYLSNSKNPTHQWIEKLVRDFPNKDFSLLIGFDSFLSIDKWIQANSLILNLSTLYIVSREDSIYKKNEQIENLKKINANLKLRFLGNHKYEHLSSSEIRNS